MKWWQMFGSICHQEGRSRLRTQDETPADTKYAAFQQIRMIKINRAFRELGLLRSLLNVWLLEPTFSDVDIS